MLEIIKNVIVDFCKDFVNSPYICYSEHGLHARFYSMLYNCVPDKERYIEWQQQKMSVIQKEYPTASTLGKPKRQNWDICVIKSPPLSIEYKVPAYDYLKLHSIIEFSMNYGEKHLIDDIQRLSHKDANVENKFIVHLYRLSKAGARFSGRDLSPNARILKKEDIYNLVKDTDIELYYGVSDLTNKYDSSVWHINNHGHTILYKK